MSRSIDLTAKKLMKESLTITETLYIYNLVYVLSIWLSNRSAPVFELYDYDDVMLLYDEKVWQLVLLHIFGNC